jgi:hypothetical protein
MTLTPTILRFADLVALGIVRNRVTLNNWIQKLGFPGGAHVRPEQPRMDRHRGWELAGVSPVREHDTKARSGQKEPGGEPC